MQLKRKTKLPTVIGLTTEHAVCCRIELRTRSVGGSRRGTGGPTTPPPLKNHKNIGFLSNTGPDPLKNHKDTKLAFNVGQSSAHQRNAIQIAFCWRADDGPFIMIFGSSIPSSTKTNKFQIWTPSDKTFWIRACVCTR